MVEKSSAVTRQHDKITQLLSTDNMAAEQEHLDGLSRLICKMPGRNDRDTVEQTMDVLFEVAASKMTADSDKEVLANLRKHVA